MKKILAVSLSLLALGLGVTQAEAKGGVKVGVLNCTIAGGVGYIIGSSKKVKCSYQSNSGRVEYYKGSIGKLGVDIGVTGKAKVAWLVFAPGKINHGALAGTYTGASAQATAIVGLGANVLVGGFKKTINLQPVSIQGQTGLNVAVGIASLNLRSVN